MREIFLFLATNQTILQDTGIAGAAFLAGIFLMPETQYDRPLEAFNGLGFGKAVPVQDNEVVDDEKDHTHEKQIEDIQIEEAAQAEGQLKLIQITELTRPDIDNVNFLPRTWRTDLRPFQRKPNWKNALTAYKDAVQLLLFPNVLLFCALNFWFLTMAIVHSATVSWTDHERHVSPTYPRFGSRYSIHGFSLGHQTTGPGIMSVTFKGVSTSSDLWLSPNEN